MNERGQRLKQRLERVRGEEKDVKAARLAQHSRNVMLGWVARLSRYRERKLSTERLELTQTKQGLKNRVGRLAVLKNLKKRNDQKKP